MADYYTREDWAHQFLADIGNTNPSNSTVQFVIGWTKAETVTGTPGYNLLNTTQSTTGSTSMNAVGVQSFPDFKTGAAANAQALKNGRYPSLLHALQTNDATALGYHSGPIPFLPGLGENVGTPNADVHREMAVWVTGTQTANIDSYLKNIYNSFSAGLDHFPGTGTGNVYVPSSTTTSTGTPSVVPPNPLDALTALSQAFTTLTSPSTWIKVGLFAFAIVLLIVGMMVLAKEPTATGAPARGLGTSISTAYRYGKKRRVQEKATTASARQPAAAKVESPKKLPPVKEPVAAPKPVPLPEARAAPSAQQRISFQRRILEGKYKE